MEVYFLDMNGKVPVVDFLEDLELKTRKKIFRELELYEEFSFEQLMRSGTARPITGSRPPIYEIKKKINKQQIRIMFYRHRDRIWLLSGFIKKSARTPQNEIGVAENRAHYLISTL